MITQNTTPVNIIRYLFKQMNQFFSAYLVFWFFLIDLMQNINRSNAIKILTKMNAFYQPARLYSKMRYGGYAVYWHNFSSPLY